MNSRKKHARWDPILIAYAACILALGIISRSFHPLIYERQSYLIPAVYVMVNVFVFSSLLSLIYFDNKLREGNIFQIPFRNRYKKSKRKITMTKKREGITIHFRLFSTAIDDLISAGIPVSLNIKLLPRSKQYGYLKEVIDTFSPFIDYVRLLPLTSMLPRIPNVVITIQGDAQGIRFTIQDTNNWIHDNQIAEILTPSFSLGEQHDLGKMLILAKNRLESWGGHLKITSSENEGTSLHITFPC